MANRKVKRIDARSEKKKKRTRDYSSWQELELPDKNYDSESYLKNVRLNSLGSLFWFGKNTLGKDRLDTLHRHLCRSLENEFLHLVMEVPMSHYKTSLGIALSIWWALGFTSRDEDDMCELGYGREWIRYMKEIHNQNTRTLVTHEIAGQAANIGRGVDDAYRNNELFRTVFQELLPDRDCTWNNSQKFQRRLPGGDATTGTYEYRGVGQALQGIHVNNVINDDNCGREAQRSVLRGDGRVMRELISWWQQCGTRYDPDSKARRQLVIGNPWCHADLNGFIKDNLPEYSFENHDAEGGCCALHPKDTPILPNAWPMDVLLREKQRLEATGEKGDYEHFYRCWRVLPWEKVFKNEWHRHFKFKQSRPDLQLEDLRNILLIEHEVYDGTVVEDFQPGTLQFRMIVDPNHAKKVNRSEHVIWVIGYDIESTRIYLLDLWTDNCGYSALMDEVYRVAWRWRLDNFWMGELAEELLRFYREQRDRIETHKLTVNTYPDDDSQAGMANRIKSIEPLFRGSQVWSHRNQKKFLSEYDNYPGGALNTLDVLGYFPQLISVAGGEEDRFLREQISTFAGRSVGNSGY